MADKNNPSSGEAPAVEATPIVSFKRAGTRAPAPSVIKPVPTAPATPAPAAQKTPPPKPAANGQKATPPKVYPPAPAAKIRRRHWGLLGSFVLFVLVPLFCFGLYLWIVAQDQYASSTGLTVRQEEGGGASDLLGGFAQQIAGSVSGSDGEILYEFILSQNLVQKIDAELDLVGHYTSAWPRDPLFALWPDPSIEDLTDYWGRIVRVSHDQGSGLIDVRVLAFSPDIAQRIAQQIVQRSQDEINSLNNQARADATGYALADLEEAVARLKQAREALIAFRSRTQIVDPEADLQSRLGVMSNLQQQLAQALIEWDVLQESARTDDPRVIQAARRIEVIRDRIVQERQSFTTGGTTGALGQDYPSLIAEYEGLIVDREFAEETYRVALTAVDLARANAQRQSRYLATYIQPTQAQSSQYPQRVVLFGIAGFFLLLAWSVMALIYYSVRDRG